MLLIVLVLISEVDDTSVGVVGVVGAAWDEAEAGSAIVVAPGPWGAPSAGTSLGVSAAAPDSLPLPSSPAGTLSVALAGASPG